MNGYGDGLDGNLEIKQSQNGYLKSDYCYNFTNLTIHEGQTLRLNNDQFWNSETKKGGKIIINVVYDLIMHKNANINCDGAGYKGGNTGKNEAGYKPPGLFDVF